WSNSSITVETDPNTRILTHLVSTPVNQAPTIIGNMISGATRLAAASLGVPTAGGAAPTVAPCLDAKAVSDRIAKNKALLTDLAGQTSKRAVRQQAALQKAINDDGKLITISFSCDIDPGITLAEMPPATQRCPEQPAIEPGKDPSH